MGTLRASGSSTNLPAYCLASCVSDDTALRMRSKNLCFQSAFEASDDTGEEDINDGFLQHSEKKRRLTLEQVRCLEKNFELENKLESQRKVQIANELGLQPRQVAVWFQNRRARWKTKKLEKDYNAMKTDYDSLKTRYDALLQEKEKIQAEMMCLKERLQLAHSQIKEHNDLDQNEHEMKFTSTLESELLETAQGKYPVGAIASKETQTEASMEEPVQAMDKEGSSISELDASDASNTSSPRCVDSKVLKVDEAANFLFSTLHSSSQAATVVPGYFPESLLKKVQVVKDGVDISIKIEPENICDDDACNPFLKTHQELPWWDWDL
eukprot:c27078_g1_i2 orf=694-1668(+)